MTDTELLNWVEHHNAQIWFDGRTKLWTCQVRTGRPAPKDFIQPSRASLRAAIFDARGEYVQIMFT